MYLHADSCCPHLLINYTSQKGVGWQGLNTSVPVTWHSIIWLFLIERSGGTSDPNLLNQICYIKEKFTKFLSVRMPSKSWKISKKLPRIPSKERNSISRRSHRQFSFPTGSQHWRKVEFIMNVTICSPRRQISQHFTLVFSLVIFRQKSTSILHPVSDH